MRIAVVGKSRSGKDTFAKHFIDKGFKKLAFADGIGEIIETYFPEELSSGKPRYLYQSIGQFFRQYDAFVWIKYLHRKLEDIFNHNPDMNIIITDVRQENEAEFLRTLGFLIVKVDALESVRVQRMIAAGDQFNQESLNHDTEKQSERIAADINILNNGTLAELFNHCDAIYKKLSGEV